MFRAKKIDVVKKGWILREDYERFTKTANSPKTIGEEARHGKESGDPPPNPMLLAEAQNFILSFIWKYISAKGDSHLLKKPPPEGRP
jgi:hypothetical protein